ncbi:TFIIH subunit Tfb4/p34 [Xylariaceae sp. FL0016]|nr:TFIIH subunit Tfb4/p34 [Xylariaceae sp. FL0016]
MNSIDASEHYDESIFAGQAPSLLTIIIDTNPRAWAAISHLLPISNAIANIMVFVNAHLAFGNDNQVAILAAHTNRAVWLYPNSPNPDACNTGDAEDVDMTGIGTGTREQETAPALGTSANKFPQFAQIETSILTALRATIDSTTAADLSPTTLISGALTMALSHIHKTSLAFDPPKTSSSDPASSSTAPQTTSSAPSLHARILILSVSDSSPAQYIPTMNAVFAASHSRIPLDTISLYGTPTFLQQAAFITSGTFLSCAGNPRGLLTYLMLGLLPDASAREHLITPSQELVDFRAACFCHRNVVDTGFVCSICLSIFCEIPEGAECLTCGTKLALGNYGSKPAVKKTKKRKKKAINGAGGREETGSATGTPVPA